MILQHRILSQRIQRYWQQVVFIFIERPLWRSIRNRINPFIRISATGRSDLHAMHYFIQVYFCQFPADKVEITFAFKSQLYPPFPSDQAPA